MESTWQIDIGLEIHVQLQTKSKLFSSASTKFGNDANTATNYVDAALPGTLPVLNQQAVIYALRFATATQAKINDSSYFERKNYFYPDLPKGYQISQNSKPIIEGGYLEIDLANNTSKKILIHHAHLEEDAGKLVHDKMLQTTKVDLNRAGNPLLEIVTSPCLNSAEEVVVFLKELHRLVKFIGISDGNMQEGSFRCDVNISLRKPTDENLGTRVEIKNLNSFRFIEKAINYEFNRHADLLTNKQDILQETRLYCPDTNKTYSMREKENAFDYRYFIEPDLRPININNAELQKVQADMPKLPRQIKAELLEQNISKEDINFITSSLHAYTYFTDIISKSQAATQQVINWLKGPFAAILKEQAKDFDNPPVTSSDFATLISKVENQAIPKNIAKSILQNLATSTDTLAVLIEQQNLSAVENNSAIEDLITNILNSNPKQVAEYKAGKEKLLAFFVGQVMKETKGRASAQDVNKVLKEKLNN